MAEVPGIRTVKATLWFGACLLALLLLAPTRSTVAQSQEPIQHVVNARETLLDLAIRYGTTTEAIEALNNLADPNRIRIGQVLLIPRVSATPAPTRSVACAATHVVRAQESLSALAVRYDVAVSEIAAANGITDANVLRIGQTLCIPGEAPAAPSPTAQPTPVAAQPTPLPAAPPAGRTHTVQSGENLFRIALAYGVTVNSLMAANGITDVRFLRSGTVLIIPGAGAPVATPVPTATPTPAATPVPDATPAAPATPTGTVPAVTCERGQFKSTFYNNTTLSGVPVLNRCDQHPLNLPWGENPPAQPAVNNDNFSARFEGDFPFEAGTYRFDLGADDGAKVWVNDAEVFDEWRVQTDDFSQVMSFPEAADYRVRVEYYEAAGNARLSLNWQKVEPGTAPAPTPTPPPAAAAPPPSAPAATPPSTPAAPATSLLDFGYGIQAYALDPDNAQRTIRHVNDLGFTWLKQQVRWKEMEPTRGRRQYGKLDDLIRRADAANVNVLFSVVTAPAWAREQGADLSVAGPPANDADFADYVGDLARRYCGRSLKAIEVWNEQNLHYEWGNLPLVARNYVDLLSATSAQIRAACPSMLIISGALTPAGNNGAPQSRGGTAAVDDFEYLRQMLVAGMANYVDAIGAHPSGYNVPPTARHPSYCSVIAQTGMTNFGSGCDNNSPHHSFSFRSTMEGYNTIANANRAGHLKIVATEFGWAVSSKRYPGYGYAQDNDYEEQADWTVQAYRMMRDWSWAGPAFLWNLNFRSAGAGTEREQWGIVNSDWSPLPVYNALKRETRR